MVQGKVKEEGLVGDGLKVGGEGGEEGFRACWGQHKLIQTLGQGLRGGRYTRQNDYGRNCR